MVKVIHFWTEMKRVENNDIARTLTRWRNQKLARHCNS